MIKDNRDNFAINQDNNLNIVSNGVNAIINLNVSGINIEDELIADVSKLMYLLTLK